MKYSVFDDCSWLFPDTPLGSEKKAVLDIPRGGHAGFQVIMEPADSERQFRVSFAWDSPQTLQVKVYEVLPVKVNENTAPILMTTTDYDSCRDYVTRQAPFNVYDALLPCHSTVSGKRPALYVCVDADESDVPGVYLGTLSLSQGEDEVKIPVCCKVYRAVVPKIGSAKLGILNFFSYENVSRQHKVPEHSEAWWRLFRTYVRAQLDMRCTHILLPAGQPLFEDGVLCGFDFSIAEKAGIIALEEGAPWLCGGHIAHWNEWTEEEYFTFWDDKTGVTTLEGYLQLRLYFSQWSEIISKNEWEGCMTQSLADEPQVHNAGTYRILAGICRKFLPGIPIIDAVETTNLGGAIDIWVPKQETYEKWRESFDCLKLAGETFWFYTCAFPAGRAMNRSMDLPLTVSRSILWMTALYALSGYLHWGFNYYIGDDIWDSACCPHKGALLPAGDAHIVYPGEDGPLRSMRFEAQRGGAEDCELLMQLAACESLQVEKEIKKVCSSYQEYTNDSQTLLKQRKWLLERVSDMN